MKLREKFKRFWTMDVHNHEGFTLVELIIVIAILAILSGVAVAGYSSYIKKANMQADRTLINEVKNALELYYYDHINDDITLIYVVLGQNGTPVRTNAHGTSAMVAAFGSKWSTLSLKFAGWEADSYTASSFAGNEAELIGVVDDLAAALGGVIVDGEDGDSLISDGFNDFMVNNGVDQENGKAVGNAAVLYVAQNTQAKDEEVEEVFSKAFQDPTIAPDVLVDGLFTELMTVGLGTAASVAAIYAIVEGYAQYSGQADAFHDNTDFTQVTNANTALQALGVSFNSLSDDELETYISSGQAMADAKGYISMMGTVHENADLVSGNLNADNCFTDGTVAGMLGAYTEAYSVEEGQVGIYLEIKDGVMTITATSDDQ